ncbi:hypothetical protein J1770_gp67 [Gordonia phage EMoore]|uniref:Uncharacterized protein n=1 Tax=Gordonia phage EMoore TaxID=2656534 RepID=A0A649VV85_9CAUD|nr:hypothetical protein J1770_gp67 [Gordonia phage EMoore]QGJ95852.1 hypothetical protein SEA_EMOORE_67 [Gordonia phage EMoore]
MTRYLRTDCAPNELVEHTGTGILGSLLTPARLMRRSLTGEPLAPSERVTELPEGWQVIPEADNHLVRALWAQVDKTAKLATAESDLRDAHRQLDAATARTKITREVLDDQLTGLRVDNDRVIDQLVKTARKRGHAEGALEADRATWSEIYGQTKQKADAYDSVVRRANAHADYIKQLAGLFGIDTDQHPDAITEQLRKRAEIAARVLSTVMARAVDDTAIDAAPMYAAEAVNAIGVADELAVGLDQRDERIAAMCRAAATEPENWQEVVPTIERMKTELTEARARIAQLTATNEALQSAVNGGSGGPRMVTAETISYAGGGAGGGGTAADRQCRAYSSGGRCTRTDDHEDGKHVFPAAPSQPQPIPGDPLEGIEDDNPDDLAVVADDDVFPLLVPVGRYKLTTPMMGGPADRLDAAVLADGTFRVRPKGTDPNSDPETWIDCTARARKLLARGRWHVEVNEQ